MISHLWERPRPFTAHPALTHLLSAPSVDPSFPSDDAVHGNARLSDAERRQLVDGLRELYATDPPAGTKQGGG